MKDSQEKPLTFHYNAKAINPTYETVHEPKQMNLAFQQEKKIIEISPSL